MSAVRHVDSAGHANTPAFELLQENPLAGQKHSLGLEGPNLGASGDVQFGLVRLADVMGPVPTLMIPALAEPHQTLKFGPRIGDGYGTTGTTLWVESTGVAPSPPRLAQPLRRPL